MAGTEAVLYKLTTQDGWTRKGHKNACHWGEGVSHSGTGVGGLCTGAYIHAYTDQLLAVLLNPIHAEIDNPALWEARGVVAASDGIKVGCVTLRTIRRLPLPVVTTEQRVRFGILCAKRVYTEQTWTAWADGWLSAGNGSATAARAAQASAQAAARAAEGAARAAALAAQAAARAARAAGTLKEAAAWAAVAAAWAVEASAQAAEGVDLMQIARQAIEEARHG